MAGTGLRGVGMCVGEEGRWKGKGLTGVSEWPGGVQAQVGCCGSHAFLRPVQEHLDSTLFMSRALSPGQLFSHRTEPEGGDCVFFPGPVPRLVVPRWSTRSGRLSGGEEYGGQSLS